MSEFSLTHTHTIDLQEMVKSIDITWIKTYTINFEADYSNSKIIRDFVGSIFDAYELNHPWKGRFILITDELINNAIEHGSKPWDINMCIITAWKGEDWQFHITLEVHDTGRWEKNKINYSEFENLKKEKDEEQSQGVYMQKRWRGLFYITEKIVDSMSFSESEKGWLAVKIEKCIESPKENTTTESCELHPVTEQKNINKI